MSFISSTFLNEAQMNCAVGKWRLANVHTIYSENQNRIECEQGHFDVKPFTLKIHLAVATISFVAPENKCGRLDGWFSLVCKTESYGDLVCCCCSC